ncbi:ABC transporter permease [Euzebya tangerina]|uniref:ABC transporter permease n=1 Tax=Euzebya tangerina TaxID=591198 RepID=UPI0013C2C388|nr:ABC transporter permease [Euzebya tangerina]
MSAANSWAASPSAVSGSARTPLSRLIAVEARKTVDTRAGFWLLVATVLGTTVIIGIQVAVGVAADIELTMADFMLGANAGLGIFVPVLGVLAVSSEWTQRTHLTTFVLEPDRARVLVAKLASVAGMAVAAVGIGVASAAAGNALLAAAADTTAVWDVDAGHVAGFLVLHLIGLLTAFALGALFQSTPVAIVIYLLWSLVLPPLFFVAASVFSWFEGVQPWIDYGLAQGWLSEGVDLTSRQVFQLLATTAEWTLLPLALGCWRVLRSDIAG